ncbi:MAG: cytochrome c [Nitrospirae bacterium]|nr:cytochrome c [Nitrospirota bacterium]
MSAHAPKSWMQIIRWKLVAAVVAAVALWFVSGSLGFPRIFQWMYVSYAVLGLIIFVALDAPSPTPLMGWKAGLGIIVFYLICSAILVTAGTLLPQFDSKIEVAGIARKTVKYRLSDEQTASLMQRTKELSAKADELAAKLNQLQAAGAHLEVGSVEASAPAKPASAPAANLSGMDPVERGKLVFQDHECYNCHQIGGKKSKKRGPILENIGNLATEAQLKDKVFHPKAWHAKGFEKQAEGKDKMPEKFAEVMSEEELHALVTFLLTLKNTAADTPQPVFPPGYSVK